MRKNRLSYKSWWDKRKIRLSAHNLIKCLCVTIWELVGGPNETNLVHSTWAI